MSHRGPRKQQYPSANGVSSNRGSNRSGSAQNVNPVFRAMHPPKEVLSIRWAYNLLESGIGNIPRDYPIVGTPGEIALAFAAARQADYGQSYNCGDAWDWEGGGYMLVINGLLSLAYQNVRDQLRYLRTAQAEEVAAAIVAAQAAPVQPKRRRYATG